MSSAPLEGLRSVRGQDHAVAVLLRAVQTSRVASAYLFEGPEGVGKERAARALAQATVCTSPRPDGDACGACPPCRNIASGRHVDVLTLAREIDVLSQSEHRASDLKSEIVVEKVRVLQAERLAFQSHQGDRWVIVRNAHEMNTPASNALLKTLEEPPQRTHFVLITSRPTQLLTTIRSRCQRVRFAPLPEAIVEELLLAGGTAEAVARDAARLADGSMTLASEYADEDTLTTRRGWVEKLLGALRGGTPGGYVDVAEGLKDVAKRDDRELEAVLTLLERHFRDDAITSVQAPRRATVNALRAECVRQAAASLDRNLNVQMTLENLLANLRDVRG